MKRKILVMISILLIFSACSKKDNKENTKVDNSKVESSQKSEETKRVKNFKKDEYKKIYDELEGKEFFYSYQSQAEAIYFYKDGYFDGAFRSGDYNQGKVSLYNGKFDIKEKLDETSYLISLRRIDYELPLGESEMRNIEGMDFTLEYIESKMYGKDDKDNLYILYLPHRKLNDIKDHERYIAKIDDKHIKDGELKVFAIGKKDASEENFMVEYVR